MVLFAAVNALKRCLQAGQQPLPDDEHPFWRFWPFAHAFHVLNALDRLIEGGVLAGLDIALLASCTLAAWRPCKAAAFATLLFFLIHMLSHNEWSNHVVVLACFDAFLLFGVWRRRVLCTWATMARMLAVATYFLAGFHKLNTGFFDPGTSCANALLLDTPIPMKTWGGWPFLAAGVEFLIPLLLLSKSLVRYGIWLGVVFHLALAIHPIQSVYDFSLVMLALISAFTRARMSRNAGWVMVALLGLGCLCAALFVIDALSFYLFANVVHVVIQFTFIGYLVLIFALGFRPDRGPLRPKPVHLLILALFCLNAATPYFGVDSTHAQTMYSNLYVADGRTNHWLISSAVGPWSSEPVAIIHDSNDPKLLSFRDRNYGLKRSGLRRYLHGYESGWVELYWQGSSAQKRLRWDAAEGLAIFPPAAFLPRPVDLLPQTRCLRDWGVSRRRSTTALRPSRRGSTPSPR